ncbi:hypothetical protein HQQ81_01780 [Microbacteriaceae bacterium VKM Ac-2854]|nr:hypothetical protein [Microbacteriaceae bacterium VKM Ac-2854]
MITHIPEPDAPATPPPAPLRRGERTFLILVLVVAFLFAVGDVIAAGFVIGGEFLRDSFPVTALTGTAVVPEQAGGSAVLQAGQYASAQLLVGSLSPGAMTLIVAGQLIALATEVIVALAVARFCTAVLTGRPFVRSITRTVTALALTILIGGLLGQLVAGLGDLVAGFELMGELDEPVYPGTLVDGTPFVVGATLLAVVLAFRIGERMQRDVDGLV